MDSTWVERMEATTRWKAARVRLSEAIQEFSEATSIFTRAVLAPASSGRVGLDVESTLDGLDLELQRLASEDIILEEAYTRLKEARNSSKRVVPINILPLGALYHIFDIVVAWANDCCDRIRTPYTLPTESDHGWKTRTVALASVCKTWRHIIVGTPSYWSHVDTRLAMGVDDWTCISTEYFKLCLQRANNTPLQVHVYCVPKHYLRPGLLTCPFPQCFHGQTICSIRFALDCTPSMTKAILDAWKDNTPTSAVRSLRIKSLTPDTEKLPVAHLHEQLHTLELRGINTDWNQIRFSGLVNLSLDPMVPIPIDQLRGILVASPALCTLVISGRHANEEDLAKFEGAPIELSKLVFLGLGRASILGVILLLRMIRPAAEFMTLSIDVPGMESNAKELHDRMWEAIQTFCAQHKISHLSLDCSFVRSLHASFIRPFATLSDRLAHTRTMARRPARP